MKYLALLSLTVFLLPSCREDDTSTSCGQDIIFASESDITSDEFTIIEALINGQCLDVTIGAGGCDGESWTAEMYAASVIVQAYPPTIPMTLTLNDEELCEAFIQHTFSFDLSSIIDRYPRFLINLEGFDEVLEYAAGADLNQ